MILFHKVLESSYKNLNSYNYKDIPYSFCKENLLKKDKFAIISIAKLNKSLYKSSNKFLSQNINYQFIARNFWTKFINDYWQETIFISISNTLSKNYRSQLKTYNLSMYNQNSNNYKNFLQLFNKHLINSKIPVSIEFNNINQKFNKSNTNKYIRYTWRKGINWYIYNIYLRCINIRHKLFKQIFLLNKKNIDFNSLPIFLIKNQHNQMILAEYCDQIVLNKDILKSTLNFLNLMLLKNLSTKKAYTGLLFINPKDSLEYQEYINYKYLKSNNNVQIFISQLKFYCKLLNKSSSDKEFRLIPDLQEVSNLVYYYQYNNNLIFDSDQVYGKNYFQGQPIYIIQSTLAKDMNTGKKFLIDYSYKIRKNNKMISYKSVFLNYKTVILAWSKFKEEHPHYKLPQKPHIYVSNLENFLQKDYKKDNNNYFVCIPSLQTYKFIKQQKENNYMNSLQSVFKYKSLYIQNFAKKIIWSLTRRYPINF